MFGSSKKVQVRPVEDVELSAVNINDSSTAGGVTGLSGGLDSAPAIQVFQPNGELVSLRGNAPTGFGPKEFKTVSITKAKQADALFFEGRSYGIAVSEASEWAQSWGAEVGDVLVEINGCVHDSAEQANRTMEVAKLPLTVRLLKKPEDTGDAPFTSNDPRAVSHVYLANQPKVVTSQGCENPNRKVKGLDGAWVYPGKFNKHSDPFDRKKVLEASGAALSDFASKERYQPIDFKAMKFDFLDGKEVATLVGNATEWRPMNAPHGKNVQVGPCLIQVVRIPKEVSGKEHDTHRIMVYSSNSQENGVKVREALVDGKLKEHIAGKWSTFADDVELPSDGEQEEDVEAGEILAKAKADKVAMRQFPSLTTETRYGLHENNARREFGMKTIALESHCKGVQYNERVTMSATVEQRQVQHYLGGEHRKVGDEPGCCDGCCTKLCCNFCGLASFCDCLAWILCCCGKCASCCGCCKDAVLPGDMYDTFTFDMDASSTNDGFQSLLQEKNVEEVNAFQRITTKGEKLRCLTIVHQRIDGRPVCLDFYVADDEPFFNISKMCAEIDMRIEYPAGKPLLVDPLNLITSVGHIADDAWDAMSSIGASIMPSFRWREEGVDDELITEKSGCCASLCGCIGSCCGIVGSCIGGIGRCATYPCRRCHYYIC